MFRKVFFVIDCADEQEHAVLQEVFKEISNEQLFNASQVLAMYPMYRARKYELGQLFKLVTDKGIKGLLSMQGANLLTRFATKK